MMRKIMLIFLSIPLISVILIGCQSELSKVEISKVSISKSNGFGKVNSDFDTVYEDGKTLKFFNDVISSLVKQAGIVNMSDSDFDLELIYTDGTKQGYHLWVGEKGQTSTLMNTDDTHTIYSISEEMTNEIIDLVE